MIQIDDNHREIESEIIRTIRQRWRAGVAEIDEPYYAGYALVDARGRVLAWLRIFARGNLGKGLEFDIRQLTEMMRFVSASGKPLLLVARFPDGMRYAAWKPGIADFYAYRPSVEDGHFLYEKYWHAIVPATALRPIGQGLPDEVVAKHPARTGTRARKQKFSKWPNVLELALRGNSRER